MLAKVLFGILIAMSIATGFLYWQNDVLKENLVKMEAAVESQKATIREMEKSFDNTLEENSRLQKRLSVAEEGIDKLRNTLSKHDLTKRAKEDAQDLEERMNNATVEVFNDIRDFTTN